MATNTDTDRVRSYVICAGDPFDGLRLYGDENGDSFTDANEANDYADSRFFKDTNWWVIEIRPTVRS